MGAGQSRAISPEPPVQVQVVHSQQASSRDTAPGTSFGSTSSHRIDQPSEQEELSDYEHELPPSAREVALQAQVDALQSQLQGHYRHLRRLTGLTQRVLAIERFITNPWVTRDGPRLDHRLAPSTRAPQPQLLSNPDRQSPVHVAIPKATTSEPGTPVRSLVAGLNLNPSVREHARIGLDPAPQGSAGGHRDARAANPIVQQPSVAPRRTSTSGAPQRYMQTRRRNRGAYRGLASPSVFNASTHATNQAGESEASCQIVSQPSAASGTRKRKATTKSSTRSSRKRRRTGTTKHQVERAQAGTRALAPTTPRSTPRQLPPSKILTRSAAAAGDIEVLDMWKNSPLRRQQNARVRKSEKKSADRG